MRCGKSLGTMNLKTDKIYLMQSMESKHLTDNEDFLKNIKKGSYIREN